MIIDIHAIFHFLGTINGDLVRKSFEFVLFIIITYMIVSEYTRDPRRELKYLIAAFGAFTLQKLLSVVILLGLFSGGLGPTTYYFYLPIIDHTLEVFSIILLSNAFLFPLLRKERKTLKPNIEFQMIILAIVTAIAGSFALYNVFLEGGKGQIAVYWSSLLFSLMKIALLLVPIYILNKKRDINYRYRDDMILGFLIYSVTPILLFTNLLLFQGTSSRLIVASHPFSILAVLQFTRVIYLRLADKAFLMNRLKISEQKYQHEKELSKMKDGFVSTISHELRTPLTSINLYNELLQKDKFGKINQKQKQALGIIKKESDRLTELINDVLDLSKLESGKMVLNLKEFDLNEFFENNPYYRMAEENKLKLINKLNKKFLIKADEDKIKRALINLISNAIKYSNKGKIILNAKSKNSHYEIIVKDQGKGMTQQELNKIFDKFYQVEDHMTRKQNGTGLGLSIVNEIIKLHKGKIDVKSKPNKGTTFTLIIHKNL